MLIALPMMIIALQADTGSANSPQVDFTADIGYVATSGNQSVATLNVGDKLAVKFSDLTVSQAFLRVYGESKGKPTTSLSRGSLRMDKGLRASPFTAYGLMTLERNTFAGLASRFTGTAGLSAVVASGKHHKVTLEGGFSLNRQRGTGGGKKDIDFLGGRAAGTYTHKFNDNASFVQSVEFLPNFHRSEDLRINTESTVTAPLTRKIAVKISYALRYDGFPQEGFESTDRLFTSGLQLTL